MPSLMEMLGEMEQERDQLARTLEVLASPRELSAFLSLFGSNPVLLAEAVGAAHAVAELGETWREKLKERDGNQDTET